MEISTYYLFILILAFFAMLISFSKVKKMDNAYYLVISCFIVVVSFGYYSMSISTTMEEMVLAKKITYFDGILLSFLSLLCSLKICNIRLPRWLVVCGILASETLFILTMTIGKSDLYYKNLSFHRENGYSYLDKDYGPAHTFFLLLLIAIMLANIAVVVYSIFHRTRVSHIHTLALGLAVIFSVSVYVAERLLHLKVELMPFAYIITEYVLIVLSDRVEKYDISRNALIALESRNEYGYIAFDKKLRYIGCDKVAKYYFPELSTLEIDRTVKDTVIKAELISMIEDYPNEASTFKKFIRKGRNLKCCIKPFRYEKEQIGYIIEIIDDTEQQNNINLLNKYNADLQAAVSLAEEASAAKTNFLSNMSHEIRTPINAIIGMTEMILRESTEKEILEYARDVKTSSQMLLSLVNDILDFSKIEAGKMELNCTTYKLKDLIHDLDVMMSPKAKDKDLALSFHVDKDIPGTLLGDDMKVKQIAVNVISNAIKYTETGSVDVFFNYELFQYDDYNEIISLNITVKDTGIGIKKENLDTLFDSFTRLDVKKNKSIEGTGLGLSITKKLVNLMQGLIRVESTYGVGSTFCISIPQTVISAEPIGVYNEATEFTIPKSGTGKLCLENRKILAVDDVAVNLKVLGNLLKKSGVELITADNGEAALAKSKEQVFDMIFMDHMMPVMDGIECFRLIKNDPENPNRNTPTVMLTANAISGMKEEYLSEGFCAYLTKPIQIKELERVIRDTLQMN